MNKPDNQPPLAAEAIKPAEAVKPEPPTVKPAEAAQPVPPVANPVEAVKPVTPATKPAEAAQPVPPVAKPVAAVKPVTPAAKPAEAVKPVPPAAKPAEVVKPVPPVAKPVAAVKPVTPAAKPAEAVKPVPPAAKPAEVVKPVPPVVKPVEAVKPVTPVAKPAEVVKPVPPVVKPVAAVKPVTPVAKPAEVVKPVPPVVKPVEAVKPVTPAAKPAEAVQPVTPAVKPAEVVKPVPPVVKPVEAVKPVPPATKPAEAVKPVTPAAKPAVKPIDTAKPTMNEANIANKPPKKTAKLNTKLSSLGGVLKGHRLLLLLVILPFLVAVLYLGVLAKDRYVSESMVVVKRADDMNIGNLSLGSLLTGGGASTKEDALLLQQYIMSPDMLQKLDAKLDFKTAFANSGWDVLQRLPQSASFEDYLAYYQDKVAVVFDEKNAVLHITTQGFDAEFAQQFNQAVLTESERFINELSHKINREEMLFANQEINRSYGQLQQAKETLLAYQNENNLVDPQVQIEATSRIVAELQTKQAQLEAELTNQLTYLNDDTPQIKAARSAIASIKQQIDKERATLTSSDNEQLNQKMFEFEELKAKVAFEGDLYKLSLAALEKSRVEAARKTKSLATISQPYLAEDARYPRRLYLLLTVFLVSLLVYGLSKVTLSIIEDHKI